MLAPLLGPSTRPMASQGSSSPGPLDDMDAGRPHHEQEDAEEEGDFYFLKIRKSQWTHKNIRLVDLPETTLKQYMKVLESGDIQQSVALVMKLWFTWPKACMKLRAKWMETQDAERAERRRVKRNDTVSRKRAAQNLILKNGGDEAKDLAAELAAKRQARLDAKARSRAKAKQGRAKAKAKAKSSGRARLFFPEPCLPGPLKPETHPASASQQSSPQNLLHRVNAFLDLDEFGKPIVDID